MLPAFTTVAAPMPYTAFVAVPASMTPEAALVSNAPASSVTGPATLPALVSVTPPAIVWPASDQYAPESTATWAKLMNCVPRPVSVPSLAPDASSSVLT